MEITHDPMEHLSRFQMWLLQWLLYQAFFIIIICHSDGYYLINSTSVKSIFDGDPFLVPHSHVAGMVNYKCSVCDR